MKYKWVDGMKCFENNVFDLVSNYPLHIVIINNSRHYIISFSSNYIILSSNNDVYVRKSISLYSELLM